MVGWIVIFSFPKTDFYEKILIKLLKEKVEVSVRCWGNEINKIQRLRNKKRENNKWSTVLYVQVTLRMSALLLSNRTNYSKADRDFNCTCMNEYLCEDS